MENEQRPIMQYVAELEGKVRTLQWKLAVRNAKNMIFCYFVGVGVGVEVCRILILKHL